MSGGQHTILLTGATGYIGSHTWLALAESGFRVIGVDDFSNSSPVVLDRLRQLLNALPNFERLSIHDAAALDAIFQRCQIDAVVHFAAFKSVGESAAEPLPYYRNNVGGLVALCEAMQRHGCRRIVFSSSATVYGDPTTLPISESAPLKPESPYAQTKCFGEAILADAARSTHGLQSATLRYFNPVGAHPSALIGEDPRGVPNNLMPYLAQVAVGRREYLQIFGNDYPTLDGTGVRDYLHVVDLAGGHVAALQRLLATDENFTVNLGTGTGSSVLQVLDAYSRACGRNLPYRFTDRRAGDVAAYWADPTLAHRLLGWTAKFDLTRMCEDSWRWQCQNPEGYTTAPDPG